MYLIILLIPTLFQIIMGNKSKSKSIEFPFVNVCIISYILQVTSFFSSFYLLSHDDGIRTCGAVYAGLFGINILFLIIITGVIIAQHFRYKY
nr:hypothetical protein [uncultured Flavobacterium sp.]